MPPRKSLDHLDCSVANTVDVIGDRWSLLIVRDAFFGVRRFDDFQKDLGIARNILADRLQGLVDKDILTTKQYQDNPTRHEYVLTDKGRDLFDVLMALWRFGDRWEPATAARVAIHDDCGHETHMIAACAHCGAELTRRNIRVVPLLDVVAERARPA
ncbi:MAG TPA: helix-turn-helix domain-containing protein [Acidimicrobiia bacterium]|jgi:DNA-binding HxlR family transcriptional regulator